VKEKLGSTPSGSHSKGIMGLMLEIGILIFEIY
jgi:hypothetical protein